MKTSVIDYLICSTIFLVLLAASIIPILIIIAPITRNFLGNYHIILDFFLFLTLLGLYFGALIHLILAVMPLKRGEFTMDDKNFTLWKILSMIFYTGQDLLLPVTRIWMRPMILALFGAKMGRDIAIGGHVDCPYLLSIGDYSIIGNGSQIAGSMTINNKIIISDVKIGNHVTIGINAVILPNVEIGDNAVVEIGSVVMPGSRIPPGERWRGNPARKWL